MLLAGFFVAPDRLPNIFVPVCELLHIRPYDSRASYGLPDGASRFQYPGLARSLTVYYVSGLVFLAGSNVIQRTERRKLPFSAAAGPAITKKNKRTGAGREHFRH
jgi:hypothetical protein